jgi:hypothetical protein
VPAVKRSARRAYELLAKGRRVRACRSKLPCRFRGGAGFNLETPVAGALSSLGALPTLGAAEGMAAADVNGDGALDLFVNSDNVQWAPGTGALDPTFSPLLTSVTPAPGNLGY